MFKKILILMVVLALTVLPINSVEASSLVGRKNFVGCWEDTTAGVGNYTTLLANNSVADLGFSFDYYVVEKEEFISIDRVTTGEVCYLSVLWVTNSSSTWVKGTTMLRTKADGNDVNLVFKTVPTDSRYVCTECCLSNVNITINNDYQINDHILWVQVTSGTMSVYWSGLGFFYYYIYDEERETETTTINQESFDPLDEGERLFRELGGLIFVIVIICLVSGVFIWIVRRIR